MTDEVIQEIIEDLNKIPEEINTTMDIRKLAEQVSLVMQRELSGRNS